MFCGHRWLSTCRYNNMKSFECKQCNKGFTTTWGLKLHVRIHAELKPSKCSKCEKSFRQSSHLQQHKRTHSELKPFKCNKCEMSFSQSSNLQQRIKELHDLKESTHKCSHCQKKFSRTSYLQIHQRIHSGTKPLQCEHCSKSFRFLSSLYRHCRSHLCDEESGDVVCCKRIIIIEDTRKRNSTLFNLNILDIRITRVTAHAQS